MICLHFSIFVQSACRCLFTGIDVWLLWLLCDDYSHSSVCLLLFISSCRGPAQKLKFHDQDRCPQTSIPPNKLIYHLASQSFPTKSWNLAPNWDNLQDKNISFVYKITLVDETHLNAGRHYFMTALNKSLRTSREANNFRLIQAFNWSKNNFSEIHISQGLDWVFPSLSHYGSCYVEICLAH